MGDGDGRRRRSEETKEGAEEHVHREDGCVIEEMNVSQPRGSLTVGCVNVKGRGEMEEARDEPERSEETSEGCSRPRSRNRTYVAVTCRNEEMRRVPRRTLEEVRRKEGASP